MDIVDVMLEFASNRVGIILLRTLLSFGLGLPDMAFLTLYLQFF